MATCKECLHYEACDLNEAYWVKHNADQACHAFKDKSKNVEQKHGRWEIDKEDIKWGNSLKKKHCTNCGKRPHFDKEKRDFILSDFCPNCGAKMDGETEWT